MKKKRKYKRGDKIWWWSEQSGYENGDKAIFVRYDEKPTGFPKQDGILAIKIGRFVQTFRWPLKLMEPL